MPLRSPISVDIPEVSVPTWLFGSSSQKLPDTPIVLDPFDPENRFLTLTTYRRYAQRFAAGLRAAGLQTGDRVLYVASNSLAFYAVYMGTLMAGGVFSGASVDLTVKQIRYRIEDADCRFLLSASTAYKKCEQAWSTVSAPAKHVYLVDRESLFDAPPRNKPTGTYRHWAELLGDASQGAQFDWNDFCSDPEQLAALNYTSGSTGSPKGVMASHRNLVANSVQWMRLQEENPMDQEFTQSLRWIGWLPMIYVFGQTQFLLTGPKRGVRNYLMESFDLTTAITLIEKYRATELFGLPAILIGIINSPVAQKADLTCIDSVQVGGAPLMRSVGERLAKVLGRPGLVVKQGWGMTEMTCIPIGCYPSDGTPSEAAGQLMPNCEGKVMSIDGATELGPNQKGEMLLRGPTVTQGYWNKPEQTKRAYLPDGWLRTEDLAYYDDTGRWYVTDRLREVITTLDGHSIIPSDIESVLLDIPGVAEAAVVSIGSNDGRAFVVLEPTTSLTIENIRILLEEKLDVTQQMKAGVFAIETIPKLPGPKVDRVALRKLKV